MQLYLNTMITDYHDNKINKKSQRTLPISHAHTRASRALSLQVEKLTNCSTLVLLTSEGRATVGRWWVFGWCLFWKSGAMSIAGKFLQFLLFLRLPGPFWPSAACYMGVLFVAAHRRAQIRPSILEMCRNSVTRRGRNPG
jgi:hypothetical protein